MSRIIDDELVEPVVRTLLGVIDVEGGATDEQLAVLRALVHGLWERPDLDLDSMTDPIEEAYELVEHGVITEQDFRELTFVNPVRLHGGANPRFFDGSVCEHAAARVLAEDACPT